MSNLWFIYAISASIMWGVGYVLSERILKQYGVAPSFLLVLQGLFTFTAYATVSWFLGTFKPGFAALFQNKAVFPSILLMVALIVGGNYLIYLSVSLKNATLSSVIESTYPLFTFVFAWLFFREMQLNLATGTGALLIMIGVIIIYLKS